MSLISKNVFPGKPMTPTGGHEITHTPPVPITAVLLSKTYCHLVIKSKQRGSWFFHKPVDLHPINSNLSLRAPCKSAFKGDYEAWKWVLHQKCMEAYSCWARMTTLVSRSTEMCSTPLASGTHLVNRGPPPLGTQCSPPCKFTGVD